MTLVLLLLVLAVVGGVAALFGGRIGGGMPDPESTVPARALPDGPVTGADVAELRFVPALRGYRMDQVDAAMDRLAAEVDRLRAIAGERADEPAPRWVEDDVTPAGFEPPLDSGSDSPIPPAPAEVPAADLPYREPR